MADMEDDKDVSRRYRELGREEPPPALDARIRAEARSAAETLAAPLVAPTGRRRWYFPVAAAAVIMLAVAVTTQIEREQPVEPVASAPEPRKEAGLEQKQKDESAKPQQPAQTDALAKRPEPRPFAQAPKAPAEATTGARSRDDFTRDNRARQEPPATAETQAQRELREKAAAMPDTGAEAKLRRAEPAREQAPAAPEMQQRSQRYSEPPPLAGAAAGSMVIAQTPEMWLEFIAELRRQGKHDDADKQLEAFRKRYPDYKIPPETLKKVERGKER